MKKKYENLNELPLEKFMDRIKKGAGYNSLSIEFNCTKKEVDKYVGRHKGKRTKEYKKITGSLNENDKKSARKLKKGNKIIPVVVYGPRGDEDEKLLASERDLLEKIEGFERESQDIAKNKIRKTLMNMRDLKRALDTLYESEPVQKFIGLCEEYKEAVSTVSEAKEEAQKLSTAKEEAERELSEVRAVLESMKNVTIFVYADGTIATEGPTIPLDERGTDKIFGRLLNEPSCQALSVSDVKNLARARAIQKNNPNKNIQVVFDNVELENVFSAVF